MLGGCNDQLLAHLLDFVILGNRNVFREIEIFLYFIQSSLSSS